MKIFHIIICTFLSFILFPSSIYGLEKSTTTTDEFRVIFASILRLFSELDMNSDGKLSFQEWAQNPQTGFLGRVRFDEYDENLDAHLDRDEFIHEHFRAALGPNIVLKFQKADANNDGHLDAEEFGKQFESTNKENGKKSGQFDKWDENGDGQLDSREFVLFSYEKFLQEFGEFGKMVEQMEQTEMEEKMMKSGRGELPLEL